MVIEKLKEVAGLYLNPIVKSLVFCTNEESPIYVLGQTQHGFVLRKEQCGNRTLN